MPATPISFITIKHDTAGVIRPVTPSEANLTVTRRQYFTRKNPHALDTSDIRFGDPVNNPTDWVADDFELQYCFHVENAKVLVESAEIETQRLVERLISRVFGIVDDSNNSRGGMARIEYQWAVE